MSAANRLSHCRITRGGRIDRSGVIRILNDYVPEPENEGTWGLTIWSEKLGQYGNGDYFARSTSRDVVEVVTVNGTVVEEIPFTDFVAVKVSDCSVAENGYLRSLHLSADDFDPFINPLDQAERGERPDLLDNSPFTRVDTKFAGLQVVQLCWGSRWSEVKEQSVVFTPEGERIPSTLGYPLSYAKWDPSNGLAQYSAVEK